MNGVIYVFHKSLVSPIPRVHGLSQVAALAGKRPFAVISFEEPWSRRSSHDRETYRRVRGWLSSRNVRHVPLRSTDVRWLEIALGAAVIFYWVVFRGVRIVHCRSYIPAVMGLLICSITPARLVFDMRGLFVDEYLSEGAVREGTARLAFLRWIERWLILHSDAIIVVSRRFRDHLVGRPDLARRLRPERIRVIPNRVDLRRFANLADARRRVRAERGWEGCVVAVYMGSARVRWHRIDLIMEMMATVMRALPDVRLLTMTYPSTEGPRELAGRAGVPLDRAEFLTVDVDEIPAFLAGGDVGLMLIDRHVSKEVCAPIKFGEYVASGLPVVGGGSMGDTGDWVSAARLGIVVDPDRIDDAAKATIEFLTSDAFLSGEARSRCLEFAKAELDMRLSLGEYDAVYRSLGGQ